MSRDDYPPVVKWKESEPKLTRSALNQAKRHEQCVALERARRKARKGKRAMSTEWKHLQQLFDDVIHALHARHTHARACSGCVRCRVVHEAANKALADYNAGLREYIG